jgi:hypothetical protein
VSKIPKTSLRCCSGPQEGRRAAHLCALETVYLREREYTRIGHLVRGPYQASRLRLICSFFGQDEYMSRPVVGGLVTTAACVGSYDVHKSSVLRTFVPLSLAYRSPCLRRALSQRSTGNGRHWRWLDLLYLRSRFSKLNVPPGHGPSMKSASVGAMASQSTLRPVSTCCQR